MVVEQLRYECFVEQPLLFVPHAGATMQFGQLALVVWLDKAATTGGSRASAGAVDVRSTGPVLNPRPIARARAFLKMAWLANPLAYLAINTVIAVIPSLTRELKLSPMFAGFFCSVWLFVRVGAFGLLWLWPGWHYRFRWLIGAYGAMVASFALILLVGLKQPVLGYHSFIAERTCIRDMASVSVCECWLKCSKYRHSMLVFNIFVLLH